MLCMNATIPAVSVEPEVSEEYAASRGKGRRKIDWRQVGLATLLIGPNLLPVSYTHLRAHET